MRVFARRIFILDITVGEAVRSACPLANKGWGGLRDILKF